MDVCLLPALQLSAATINMRCRGIGLWYRQQMYEYEYST